MSFHSHKQASIFFHVSRVTQSARYLFIYLFFHFNALVLSFFHLVHCEDNGSFHFLITSNPPHNLCTKLDQSETHLQHHKDGTSGYGQNYETGEITVIIYTRVRQRSVK